MVEEEVAELEQVIEEIIVIDIPEVTEEELEEHLVRLMKLRRCLI